MIVLMDETTIRKVLIRLSYEIIEKNKQLSDIILIGIKTRGTPLAARIAANLERIEGISLPYASLNITRYRDDIPLRERGDITSLDPKLDLNDKKVIVIDDVLHKGRTIRAAMDAIIDQGRPKEIQFLVLIDRGHREFPIRADYIGKNIPTSNEEEIKVRLMEIDGEEKVILRKVEEN